MVNVAAIYSTLGNPNSLIPLLVKDSAQTVGMTTGSMLTGKEEGHDRLIDEVGTEFIWLCAIPEFKKLYNSTIYKAFKLDSEFDVRNFKDKEIFKKIKDFAPTDDIKKNIEKLGKKEALGKNLALYRFFFSTGMAIASYIGLTKAKQIYTENKIKKNLIAVYNAKKAKENNNNSAKNNEEPTFKGVGDVVKNFAFSPVKNMWILDGAITTERLVDSRTPQEFAGYAIKEASILCFLYYAGGKIQKALESRAEKKHNKNIALDARVIENGNLQKSFENGSVKKSLESFKAVIDSKDVDLYEFIHKNSENDIIKAAKESHIISMYEKPKKWYEIFKNTEYTDKIDTRKYLDLDEVKDVYKNIEKLYSQYTDALKSGETSENFFKQVKKLKRGSIITNIGTCMFALGVVTPAIMVAKRLIGKDDAEFQTKKEIRKQLIKEGIIA